MNDKKSFVMYKGWLPLFDSMTDEQAGQLFKALCAYQSGEVVRPADKLLGAMYDMMVAQFEEDDAKYEAICKAHAEAGKLGGRPKTKQNQMVSEKTKQNQTKPKKADKDKDKEEDKDKEKEIPKEKKTQTSLVNESELSEGVKAKLLEWLKYKQERKESYKETGLKALLAQVRKRELEYGAQAVCDCIDTSMSNCWKGIIWDKLAPRAAPKQNKFTSFPQRTYTHDEMSELERQLLEN
jgi:hypothetical protein